MKIYRGVNLTMFTEGRGLRPRGIRTQARMFAGHAHFGDGQVLGLSTKNAVLQHQLHEKAQFGFLSFSTSRETAFRYALHAEENGVIYETDTDILSKFSIKFIDTSLGTDRNFKGDSEFLLYRDVPQPFPVAAFSEHPVRR